MNHYGDYTDILELKYKLNDEIIARFTERKIQ
jgi:hypothetical protein